MLPLDAISRSLPERGTIVDLGCGQGVIAEHLALVRERRVLGVDSDSKRIEKAALRTAGVNNLSFQVGDIRTLDLRDLSGVVLSDVLHHVPPEDRPDLIAKIRRSLNPDGVLVIKEVDNAEFIRGRLSRLWDTLLYSKDQCFPFYSKQELTSLVCSSGFRVRRISREARLFPGSTTLYVFEQDNSLGHDL